MADRTEDDRPIDEVETKVLLAKLVREVHELNQKFDTVVELGGRILKTQEECLQRTPKQEDSNIIFKVEPDMVTLFDLPIALRKTVMALYKLGEATAEELANETKRLRAVESSSANQLVRMGLLAKRREGREVYFFIE